MIRVQVQIDIRLVRFMLAALHIFIAVIAFVRHNMVDFVTPYAAFGKMGNTVSWGIVALFIGVGLLGLKRGTVLMVCWQFASASYFTTFALLISSVNGLTWATAAYIFPAALSFVVMWSTLHEVFDNSVRMQAARTRIQDRRHV